MENLVDKKSGRLVSLDALRGFDMLFIMGLAPLVVSVCSLFPGGESCWLAGTMDHAQWHGFNHHDTIFPLFLFIAGISFPFSYAKQQANGASRGRIYLKIFRRAITLVLLGLVYNGLFNLDFKDLRVASVLGRIGVAWMVAALLFINLCTRTRAVIAALILVGYWLLLWLVPAPDAPAGADPFSFEYNLAGYVDQLLLPGAVYYGTFDPEGILSTLPAVVTAMLGMFTGEFVRLPENSVSGRRKALYMFLAAVVFLAVGLLWNTVFPVNKKLWTSSFVCVVASYSLGLFSLFYYLADVRKWQGWTLFFRVVGLNSITIYLAQVIVDFGGISDFFLGGLAGLCSPQWGAVINGAGYMAVCWLFLYFLYKHKVFLKV